MNFWRWYLGILSLKGASKRIFSADNEFAVGCVVAVAGLIIGPLGIIAGGAMPLALWFIVLIPIGVTIAAHGYWRRFKK